MWILILTLVINGGAGVTTHEFNTEEECKRVAAAWKLQEFQTGRRYSKTICIKTIK